MSKIGATRIGRLGTMVVLRIIHLIDRSIHKLWANLQTQLITYTHKTITKNSSLVMAKHVFFLVFVVVILMIIFIVMVFILMVFILIIFILFMVVIMMVILLAYVKTARDVHVTVYLYGEFFFRIIDLVLQRGNRYELSFLRTPKKSIPNIYHY